jgi:hypothetical protein
MARYLLVAHQTANSPELAKATLQISSEDSDAAFVVLIPATPVVRGLMWDEGETKRVARDCGQEAASRLRELGVNVISTKVGDADPVYAVGDELQSGSRYQAVVISTLPAGPSRWLKMDVLSRLRRHFPSLRVVHIVADIGAVAETQTRVSETGQDL